MAFDFSGFFGGQSKRPVEFLGLTIDQTQNLLNDQHGISAALMERYPDVTKRGNGPNAVMQTLIVFEAYGRDTTYSELANALEVSENTVYQKMATARKWVKAGLKLNIEHSGDRVYLVTNESLAAKAEQLDGHISKMERVMENLASDVNSIRQAGQTPVLPGKAAAMLGGYEQVKQLTGAGSSTAVAEPETTQVYTPDKSDDGAYNL